MLDNGKSKDPSASDKKVEVAALRKKYILPVITACTFAGTSLWFAGNAVVRDIQKAWVLGDNLVAYITSSVQIGFIVGTAVVAVTGIVDKYPPGRVFCVCCLIGAFFNASIYLFAFGLSQLLLLRFLIGFCLAGIYPVALKIAKGWYDVGLGYAMGCVVSALAFGTAFPHFIKGTGGQLPWGITLISVSTLAALGGIVMWAAVPDGPLLKKGSTFKIKMLQEIFQDKLYTQASLAYYGHMWEQYSFWGYLPMMLDSYSKIHHIPYVNVSVATFFAISSGALGAYITGWGTKYITSSSTACFSIFGSGICGLLHPIFYGYGSFFLYMSLLMVWGWNVTSDSPQFSALAARACKTELLGTALTVYNCIGYSMTIVSIELCQFLAKYITYQYIPLVIAIGPLIGGFIILPRARAEGIWIIPENWRRPSLVVGIDLSKEVEMKPMATIVEESKPSKVYQEVATVEPVVEFVAPTEPVLFDIGSTEETDGTPVEDADLIGKRQSV